MVRNAVFVRFERRHFRPLLENLESRLLPGETLGALWLVPLSDFVSFAHEPEIRASPPRPCAELAQEQPNSCGKAASEQPLLSLISNQLNDDSRKIPFPPPSGLEGDAVDLILVASAVPDPSGGDAGGVATITNLPLYSSTYLTGPGSDEGTAVDLSLWDGAIVFAGRVEGEDFGLKPVELLGGGPGALLRFDTTGITPLSLTRFPGSVLDMETQRTTGDIALIGTFGVALIAPDGSGAHWHVPLSTNANKRVAVGDDGTVAALDNKTIRVFDSAGKLQSEWTLGNNFVNDLAIDAASGTVIVTGFDNKRLPGGGPVQVAYVYGYTYGGTRTWVNYDWPGGDLATNQADTRGMRVTIGRDGLLYFAGESAGGNTIYRWNPRQLNQPGPNVRYDQYNDPYNTASNHITYYARMNPSDGEIFQGQFLLSRLSSTRGNTIRPHAITADELGNVYLTGASACCIANRDQQQIADQPIGTYRGDPFLLVVQPDFRQRLVWTAWSGQPDGGSGTIRGVTAGYGVAAVTGNLTAGQTITYQAIQDQPAHEPTGAAPAAFLAVFPEVYE